MIITAPFRESNPRLAILGGVIGLGLLVLLLALFRVQVLRSEHYDSREEAQSLRRIRIPSARGDIVDRNGVVLANNRPSYDIAIYLDQLGQLSKKQDVVPIAAANLAALSQTLYLPCKLSDNDVRIHYRLRRPIPMTVWQDLSAEKVAAFEEGASNLLGADLIVTPVRQYPFGPLAAHILGYVGKADQNGEDEEVERFYYYQPDSVGRQGVERSCDEYLRGAPGGRTIRVNPGGIRVGEVGEKTPERGAKVTLTIDWRKQKIVEDALAGATPAPGKDLRGAAVLLDVRTGEVLAMASVPDFDPNDFNPGKPNAVKTALLTDQAHLPMYNRAIGGAYAPGSTFKTITLLAGLETGAILPEHTQVCTGSLKIGDRSFGCHEKSGHGRVDAFNAITKSCDVWFYLEGMKTGIDAISKEAAEFGLGQPTGFDIGTERSGLVPTPAWKWKDRAERWWDGDTAQFSIGQSFLLATPLQMACVAATFANGGTCLQPYIVKRIELSNGQVVHEGQTEVRGRLTAKPEHIEFVRRAMLGAVQEGTASKAEVSGLVVAGKTGTAEYNKRQPGSNRVWFIGFAPYDQPQMALAVVIEDGASGGGTAAPVAARIFAGIFGKTAKGAVAGESGGYAD